MPRTQTALYGWKPQTRDPKKRQDKFYFDLETEDTRDDQWRYDKTLGCWVINLSGGKTIHWEE